MNCSFQRLRLAVCVTVIGITLAVSSIPSSFPIAHAGQTVSPPEPAPGDVLTSDVLVNGASLHNPGIDNHDWYEFDWRYQGAYPAGSWLPDDDNNEFDNIPDSVRQDWRLWFQDGTEIVETDPEATYVQAGDEAIQFRSYGGGDQLAGLYQPIYNVTPCLMYKFQMYAHSRPKEANDSLTALQVGIDKVGWHPESKSDPAVHSFPSTTVWGTAHTEYQWYYGPLEVTAEALANKITVFTYADAPGGRSHRVLWDSGSLQVVATNLLSDPDNPPPVGGIVTAWVDNIGNTTARINWTTNSASPSQVYYRRVSAATPTSPTTMLTPTVYLPFTVGDVSQEWLWTTVNTSPVTVHYETLIGLQPNTKYEYIAVSRGLSSGQCTSWASQGEFTTAP